MIKKLQTTLLTGELAVRKWLGYKNNYMKKPTIPKLKRFISVCTEVQSKLNSTLKWANLQLNELLEEQEYKKKH